MGKTLAELRAEWLGDDETRAAYEDLALEFASAAADIAARTQAGNGFRFNIVWDAPLPASHAELATAGRATLWVGQTLVWGEKEGRATTGVHWHWVDLLAFLAEQWKYLIFEQAYPLDLTPAAPHLLRRAAEEKWEIERNAGALADERYLDEEEKVFSFEERHNLAVAIQGLYLPSVYLMRTGDEVIVSGADGVSGIDFRQTLPLTEVRTSLEDIGEQIAGRLRSCDDAISRARLAEWEDRHPRPTLVALRVALGAPAGFVTDMLAGTSLAACFAMPDDRLEDTELLAAARLSYQGSVSSRNTRLILDSLREITKSTVPQLDAISREAEAVLRDMKGKPPHDQGRGLAAWLRQKGCVPMDGSRALPDRLLDTWGIPVTDIHVSEPNLDAVACWGPTRGPIILLNRDSRRHRRDRVRRTTLAHEICHLLVDRHSALPFAEVMAGDSRDPLEQRARAFAAELLVPRPDLERRHTGSKHLADWVVDLTTLYDVSSEVVAWQIRNSAIPLNAQAVEVLKLFVHAPDRMD